MIIILICSLLKSFFFFRSICFKRKSKDSMSTRKIVAEEIIEEIREDTLLKPTPAKQSKPTVIHINKSLNEAGTKNVNSSSSTKRKQPLVLVKPKPYQKTSTPNDIPVSEDNEIKTTTTNKSGVPVGSLSMLSAYLNSSEESE